MKETERETSNISQVYFTSFQSSVFDRTASFEDTMLFRLPDGDAVVILLEKKSFSMQESNQHLSLGRPILYR